MIPSAITELTERMNSGGVTLSAYLTPDGDVKVEGFIDVGTLDSQTNRYVVGRADGDYRPCVAGVVPDAFTIEECLRDCITFGNEGHDWATGGAVYVGGYVRSVSANHRYLGTNSAMWVFDPVVICHTLEGALDVAHTTNQTHIYDLYRGVSIPVGGA